MKRLFLLLVFLPALCFAGTNDQLPDADRTDWLPVQQTWGGGASTRGSIQVGMTFSLIEETDLSWLDTAIAESPAVVLNTAKRSYPVDDESKLSLVEPEAKDDQTGAEIKALYEAEAETNALTDTLLTKLNGIEDVAKDDQTGAEISGLLDIHLGTTDWQSGGEGGVSQLDALTDITGTGTLNYFLMDDGDGTYSFQSAPTALDELTEMIDITNAGAATDGLALKANGDGSFTFEADLNDDTDDQTLSWASPNLSIADGNSVDLSGLIDADELTAAELAAVNGAALPSGTNVFATIDDVISAGGGDMDTSTYDPLGAAADAFDMDNMVEGATNLILTGAERSEIATNTLKRNYPIADETKLTGIDPGANVNVNSDWTAVGGDAEILNKPTTLAGFGITDAATDTQGALADTALQSADMTTHEGAADPHTGYVLESNIGVTVQGYDADTLAVTAVNSSILGFSAVGVLTAYAAGQDLPVAIGVDATGFNGNLTTADDTIQEVAQALDDLAAAGATELDALTDVTGTGTTGWILQDDGDGTYSFIANSGGTDDQVASEVPFTGYLTITSTDLQAALSELKDELDVVASGGGGTDVGDATIDGGTASASTADDIIDGGASS